MRCGRALYCGHVKVALLLLRAGCTLGDELTPWRSGRSTKQAVDKDGFTPLSLLSWRLRDYLREAAQQGSGGDVFTFGKADFQLGYCLPNTADVQKPRRSALPSLPYRLRGPSQCLTVRANNLWMNGGGRVESLANGEVVEVAAAKYHSVALTKSGHVYTWYVRASAWATYQPVRLPCPP